MNSGHEIHKEQPQLVIDAIREVVEAVRSGKRSLTQGDFSVDVPSCVARLSFLPLNHTLVGIRFRFAFLGWLWIFLRERVQDLPAVRTGLLFAAVHENNNA